MKKILLAENSEKAEAFIRELEDKLLPALRKAHQGILDLGIKAPDKKLLFEVIQGSFDSLNFKFWETCQPDIDVLQSPVSKRQMKTDLEYALTVFLESLPMSFAQEIDGKNISNSFFEPFIDFDEKEGPFLSDLTRESIHESYKQYLETEQHIKIFETHQTAAKALQKFIEEFSKSNLAQARFLGINPGLIIANLFKIEILENGKFSVNPGEINYGLQFDPEVGTVPYSSSTTYTPQFRGDVNVSKGQKVNSAFLK